MSASRFATSMIRSIIAVSSLFVALFLIPRPSHAIVPFGFSDDLIANGFTLPVGVEFDHLGRTLVWEKRGIVWIVDAGGTVLPTPLIDLSDEVHAQHDKGMLGMVLDPDYATNGFIYFLYNVDPIFGEPDEHSESATFGRVTRYTVVGDQANLGSRLVLIGNGPLDGIPNCHKSHSIGTLDFGADGSLLVGSGDGAHYDFTDGGQNQTAYDPECEGTFGSAADVGAIRSQTFDTLAGKILRIDPATGLGYADNPWYDGDTSSVESMTWCLGLRNPFRFTVRPLQLGQSGPGSVYIGDVGWGTWEELNVSSQGGENFGWPCYEGTPEQGSYQGNSNTSWFCDTQTAGDVDPPLIEWHHSNPGASGFVGNAASGAVFYTGTSFPSEYWGKCFYADYGDSWIRCAEVDASDALVADQGFATGLDRPVDIKVDPNTGDLVYASITTGAVRRIRYTLGPTPPVVVVGATPTSGPLPLDVQFSSDGTTDPNGDPFTLEWDFGDGFASTDPNPLHQYTTLGTFEAWLVATDIGGAADSSSITIQTLNLPPTVTITNPPNGSTFTPPEFIPLLATASDPEDGTNLDWEWQVDLIHNDHPHPGWFTSNNQTPQLLAESHGDVGDRFSYRVRVDVTDTGGEAASDTTWIVPEGQVANNPPIPAFTMAPYQGPAPLVVQFDGTPSADPDNDLMIMDWNFGDGTGSSGTTPSHIYGAPGLYTVQLTVHDPGLATGMAQGTVLVEPSGVMAHWPLDENGGTLATDVTGGGHDGTVSSAFWAPGVRGSALDFDGASAWVGTGQSFLSNRGAFSLVGWVFPRSTGNRVGLIGQNDAVEFGFISTAQLQVWTSGGGSVGVAWPFPMSEWHHVAALGDGSSLRLYIDGTEAASVLQSTGNYGSSSDAVNFGGGGVYDATGNWFDGMMDDVRIYDRALSPADVALLATLPPANTGPVVDAGPDGNTLEGQIYALLGSVTDDGMPSPPGQAPVTWAQVSGPGSASIFAPTSLFTQATFPAPGTYVLSLVADDGEIMTTDTVSIEVGSLTAAGDPGPTVVGGLHGIAPNPVQGRSVISYGVTRDGAPVRIAIHGVDGRRVSVLVQGESEAGVHHLAWSGQDDHGRRVASGVYFLVADVDGQRTTRKMSVMR